MCVCVLVCVCVWCVYVCVCVYVYFMKKETVDFENPTILCRGVEIKILYKCKSINEKMIIYFKRKYFSRSLENFYLKV